MKQKTTSKKVYLVELKTQDKPIRVSAETATEATQKVYKKYSAKCGLGAFISNIKSCSRITSTPVESKESYNSAMKLYSKYKKMF